MTTRELMTQLNEVLQQIDTCYARLGARAGLTWNALMFLYLLDSRETLTQADVCSHLFLSKSTVHSILLDLMKKDIVALEPAASRQKQIRFTENGRAFFAPVLKETERLEENVVNRMGRETMESLLTEARKIAGMMDEWIEETV